MSCLGCVVSAELSTLEITLWVEESACSCFSSEGTALYDTCKMLLPACVGSQPGPPTYDRKIVVESRVNLLIRHLRNSDHVVERQTTGSGALGREVRHEPHQQHCVLAAT
jgi:hypothetical protein